MSDLDIPLRHKCGIYRRKISHIITTLRYLQGRKLPPDRRLFTAGRSGPLGIVDLDVTRDTKDCLSTWPFDVMDA